MIDFKDNIADEIAQISNINKNELISLIEIPPDDNMGDYAFPCFRLAKQLKKSPQAIAEELKEKISLNNDILEKMETAGGYLNFYINKKTLIKNTISELEEKKEEYGRYWKWKNSFS